MTEPDILQDVRFLPGIGSCICNSFGGPTSQEITYNSCRYSNNQHHRHIGDT